MNRFQQVETYIFNKLEKELSPSLYYHGFHHTKDVLKMVSVIAATENVEGNDLEILKVAAVLHDAGFLNQYNQHEEAGCKIAREILPQFDFTTEEIERICSIIMATKIPQSPHNLLEEIICDADLDYLGRDDFEPIAAMLFEELKIHVQLHDEKIWNNIQVNFIGNHRYFRPFGQKNREPHKQVHLAKIKDWLQEHSKE